MSLLLLFGQGNGGGGPGGNGTPIGLLLALTVTGEAPQPEPEATPPRRGGAFYPTRAEIAHNRVRQRQIGNLFATPLSWLDKKPSERKEAIQELQEAVQEAIEDVAAIRAEAPVPQLPSIDWEAIKRKREYERIGQELQDMLRRLDEMIEMANEEDDIEIILLS